MTIKSFAANSTRRFTQVETWTWGLLNSVVVGGSTSVTSWLGLAAAHSVGVDVPVLNFKGVGIVFLSGALVRFFAYLSQGLPNLTQTTETSFARQSADGSTVVQSSQVITSTPVDAKSGLTSNGPSANTQPLEQPKI